MSEERSADYFLDITAEVCPLTFVKTKLCLEKMKAGQTLDVRLNAGEPLENVPRTLVEQGHRVIEIAPEDPAQAGGIHRLRVQKG